MSLRCCWIGCFALGTACGSSTSGSDGTPSNSQACTSDCIEADLEMPDGTTQHYRSAAVGGSMPATHRLGVSSVEEDGEVGLNLIFDARKVKSGDTTPVAPDISDGATLWVRRGDGKVFIGKSGQIVFRALSEVSGSSMSGTFDGIASEGLSSKEDPSADAIKVTNGVFYATVP